MTVNVTDTVGANNTIVLDGSSKIPAFDGSQVTALDADVFTTGSLATARIDVGTTAGKILQLDGSARMPAISGANLVNAPGPTISTSDPTISTNLTLGTKWVNKTSGEVYICTDATAGSNVWTNVGAGSGDVLPWAFGGENYGYSYGGTSNSNINRWSLTSDGNATDVGDQSVERRNHGGASSATYGYNFGGWPSDVIDKFPFASGGTATDVGNLLSQLRYVSSATTADYGWCAGGAAPDSNVIQRFAFASDGNSTDWADIHTAGSAANTGMCSVTHGYLSGGHSYSDQIEKYPFASQSTSTDVGNLTYLPISQVGISSETNGYGCGGNTNGSVTVNTINKISFTTDGNATDTGDILTGGGGTGRFLGTGVSSLTYGYVAGGGFTLPASDGESNIIDKMSFSADGNSTDVGDLTQVDHYQGQGSQY